MNTKPSHGPIHFRAPAKIHWRTIRGQSVGPQRLKAYEGVPPPYDKVKRMVIPDAIKVLRLQPGHKYCLMGQLSKEVGWNHFDTIKAREYRIIFIYGEGEFSKSSVLSLATKLLRLIPVDVSHPPHVNRAPIIFNGALHWMINDQEYRRVFEAWPHCSQSIVIFDMEREEFSTMPHPGRQCASKRRHYCMGLLEMEGHLCFPDNSSSEVLLDIWILEDSINQVWAKRHIVHTAPIKSLCKVVGGWTRFTLWKEAEVEAIQEYGDNLLLRVYYKNLFLYNLRLGTFVRVGPISYFRAKNVMLETINLYMQSYIVDLINVKTPARKMLYFSTSYITCKL
ncbi:hypothetical protein IFM89_026959 [Coptis chinensis]|uniref:F-box associated beta-propeller type 3 domain-containing protein n=1 Tax=Coptis chinensis TaxID=261450 RepID=A0A835I1W5_9MAGN|nr:hypothetical protein IFM89_026959 [Coptis chinensis]